MERKLKKFKVRKNNVGGRGLVLRPARMGDAKALNAIINEDGVNSFLIVEKPVSLASTRKLIAGDRKRLWIVAYLDGKAVGSVMLRPGEGRKDVTCGFGI